MTKDTTHHRHHTKKTNSRTKKKTNPQLTYRGKPDKRPIKYIFVNTDGNVCFAPSLTWICTNYHISKGSISDVHNKKVRSYMGWYSIDKSKLEEVVLLLGLRSDWKPSIGKHMTDPDKAYNFIMKQELF